MPRPKKVKKGKPQARTAKLNAKNVWSLAAPEKGWWIWWDKVESAPKGFGLRVTCDGARAYVVRYRVAGKQRLVTVGKIEDMRLKRAREIALEYREDARAGIDKKEHVETLRDLVDKYIASKELQALRTRAEYERILVKEVVGEKEGEKIGDIPPEQVTKKDIRKVLDGIVERGSPMMANRVLGVVQALYSWAVKQDEVERPPTWPEPPAKERERDRVLTDEEVKKVWAAMDLDLNLVAEAFRMMLITAQRRGEVLQMEWSEITQEPVPGLEQPAWWWTIPESKTKNKEKHRVPLTDMAVGLLERVKARALPGPWVFPSDRTRGAREKARPIRTPSHGLARLRENCDVKDFRLHDFRRTAASNMSYAGISLLDIAYVLNHTARIPNLTGAPRVTRTYARNPHDREKRRALETWERRLLAIITGKGQANVVSLVQEARA